MKFRGNRDAWWRTAVTCLLTAFIANAVFAVELPKSEEEKKKLSGREIKILRRQMKDREDTAGAAYKNAETSFLVGEYDKAIEEYLAVSREYEDTSYRMKAVLRVGDVYYRQKKYDRAISYYQRSLKVPSEIWWPEESVEDYARADYMIGVCYYDQNAMNRAFAQFRRFIQKHPDSKLVDRAYDFIGRGNMAMKRYGQAIEAFRMVGTSNIQREARRTVSPGEDLYVRVVDPDVGLATRNGTIPVMIKTSAGDEEVVELKSLGLGSPSFLGTIKTRLGAPRLTKALDEAFPPDMKEKLDAWLLTAKNMRQDAKDLENQLAQLEEPGPAPEGNGPEAEQEKIKHQEVVSKYEAEKKRLTESVAALNTGADKLSQQTYAAVDIAFGSIEQILKAWDVKEEFQKEAEADKPADEEKEAEPVQKEEEKKVSLSDVFTPQQINETRTEVKQKPTDEKSYRYRRALLEYWHEQLLREYKTLDVNGSDTITVEYVDAHGALEDGQKRIDELTISSDGIVFCVGPDYENLISAVILGDNVRIRLIDPDMDRTADKDTAEVVVASIPKQTNTESAIEEEEAAEEETPEDTSSVDVFANYEEEDVEMPEMAPKNAPFITVTLTETAPHSGVFMGEIPTIPASEDDASARLELSPYKKIRIAYSDKRTSSHMGEWVETDEIEIVPGSTGQHEVIEMQESELDRRSELEKGIALGKLARVYQDLGLKLESRRAFDEALKVVKKVVDSERGSPLGEEATYQMWDLYFASGDEEAAAEACSRLIATFPNSPLADDALLIMGKAAEKKYIHQAMAHYNRLVTSYPDSDLAPEAQFRIADLKARAGNFDVAAFESCANKFPDSNFAAESLLRLGEYYIDSSDFARARDYLERITLDFPDFDGLDKVTYMRGICAYRTGDIELSYTLMHETIEKYPGTAVARSAGKVVELLAKKLKR